MIAFRSSGVGAGHIIPDAKIPQINRFNPTKAPEPPIELQNKFKTASIRATKQKPRMNSSERTSITLEEIDGKPHKKHRCSSFFLIHKCKLTQKIAIFQI
jgi:hypothetical protein